MYTLFNSAAQPEYTLCKIGETLSDFRRQGTRLKPEQAEYFHTICWLEWHDVIHCTKEALLAPPEKYIVDELAKSHEHEMIHLPLYHCHFNSIEFKCAQIKNTLQTLNRDMIQE